MTPSRRDRVIHLGLPSDTDLRVAMVRHACAYTDRAPAIEVSVTSDPHGRTLCVVMYVLAALVEARSKDNPWHVEMEELDGGQGRLVVHLGTESHDEAARALKLLQEVVASLRGS
jgi:hypothetical protein